MGVQRDNPWRVGGGSLPILDNPGASLELYSIFFVQMSLTAGHNFGTFSYNIIHKGCMRKWLLSCNFRVMETKKGLYYDGHEREDVVKVNHSITFFY